jgi:hypothetical protein
LQALRHNTVALESALIDWNTHADRIANCLRRISDDLNRSANHSSDLPQSINALRFELMGHLRRRNVFARWLLELQMWWAQRAWRRHLKAVEEKTVDFKTQADEIADRNPSGRWT